MNVQIKLVDAGWIEEVSLNKSLHGHKVWKSRLQALLGIWRNLDSIGWKISKYNWPIIKNTCQIFVKVLSNDTKFENNTPLPPTKVGLEKLFLQKSYIYYYSKIFQMTTHLSLTPHPHPQPMSTKKVPKPSFCKNMYYRVF